MNRLKKYGLEEHYEIGPSKVLSSLAKQNRVKGSFSSLIILIHLKSYWIDMEHKKVIVTGGNRGIGKGIVLSLLDQGYHVLATSRDSKKFDVSHPKFKIGRFGCL